MKSKLFLLMVATLVVSVVAEDSLEMDRRSPITGFAQIIQRIMTGFVPVENSFDEDCNYFPRLNSFSSPDILYFAKVLNSFMCDSGFNHELAEIAKIVNLLLQVVLTEFDGRPGEDKPKEERVNGNTATAATTKAAPTNTEATTTTAKVFENTPRLYATVANPFIYIYQFSESNDKYVTGESADIEVEYHPDCMFLDATRQRFITVIPDRGFIDVSEFDSTTGLYKPRTTNTIRSKGFNYATLDSTNKYLLASNFGSGQVIALELAADGTLKERTKYDPPTNPKPTQLAFLPKAKEVLAEVANGDDQILFLTFISNLIFIAKLTKEVPMAPRTKPYRMVFSSDGTYMYVACQTHIVQTFKITLNGDKNDVIDVVNLGIDPTQARPQPGAADSNVELVIHPNGGFLYVLDFGAIAVAMFKIDSATGKLSPNGFQEIDTDEVTDIVISTDGTTLFVSSYGTKIFVFKINLGDGKLETKNGIEIEYFTHKLYYG